MRRYHPHVNLHIPNSQDTDKFPDVGQTVADSATMPAPATETVTPEGAA